MEVILDQTADTPIYYITLVENTEGTVITDSFEITNGIVLDYQDGELIGVEIVPQEIVV